MKRQAENLLALNAARARARLSAARASFLVSLVRVAGFFFCRRIVCVALVEHLGDIAAAEPISRKVYQMGAGKMWVVWITKHQYADLPKLFPSVNLVVSVTNLGAWILLKKRLAGVRVYDLHLDKRWCPETNWSLVNETANPQINDKNYYDHVNLLGLGCANSGVPIFQDQPILAEVKSRLIERLGLSPKGYIVAHARSNEADREWDEEKWRDLLHSLSAASGLTIVEVGLSRPVLFIGNDCYRPIIGDLSIQQLCEIVLNARIFIGVDSGPAHIANAYKIPAIIMVGRYRAFLRYVPYSGWLADNSLQGIIHYDGPLHELPVGVVLKRALNKLVGLQA